MKVVYLCGDDLAKKRGYTVHTLELARNLTGLGAEVVLFAPSLGRITGSDGLKIIYAPTIDMKALRPISFRISLSVMLLRRLLAGDADIIYVREITLYPAPAVLGKIFKRPVVIEINNAAIDGVAIKPADPLTFLKFYARKISFLLADRIIVANNMVRDLLSREYNIRPDKFAVIPMGANVELFQPMDKYLCRGKVGLKEDHEYVGFVGTLYPFQALEYLVAAAPLILAKRKDVKFLIVGSGINETRLKGMVNKNGLSENFIFTGEKEYEVIPYYINSLDLCVSFVTPERSRSFSFPIKIYEYLSCERPVVIGKLGIVGGILGTKATPVVDAADPQALSKAVVDMLEHPDELKNDIKKLRRSVEDEFSWKKTAENTLKLFESITSGSGSS